MRSRLAALAVLCVLNLLSGVFAVVSSAAADPVQGGPLERPDEASAAVTASQTGQQVVVSGLRSETTEVVANPSGTFTATVSPVPVRVQRDGGWVPVDTTLTVGSDGTVSPGATVEPIVLSGGGTQPLVRMGPPDGELSLSWPAPLPAPILLGDTATYPEVLPGVDLAVQVSADGFADFLVVKDATAAQNPALSTVRFGMSVVGLTVSTDPSGAMLWVDGAGNAAFVAPPARMWDSAATVEPQVAGALPEPGAHQAAVGVQVSSNELTLTPDQGLLTATDTHFPVVIDPPISVGRSSWTKVFQQFPTTSYWNGAVDGSEAKVGHSNEDNVTVRTFFTMATSTVNGKQIISAHFRIQETYAWSCNARPVDLWETGGISSATTWNTQPSWIKRLNTQNVARGYSDTLCPDGPVEFDALTGVKDAASHGWSSLTLGLKASDETDTFAWKKFTNNPVIDIEYNSVPNRPTNMTTDPKAFPDMCRTGAVSSTFLGSTTPKLIATLSDPDGGMVRGRFEWWHTGGSIVGSVLTSQNLSGRVFTAQVPAGAFQDGDQLSWHVRTEDGSAVSAWTQWCEYTIDSTAPNVAPVVSSTDYPEMQWAGSLGRSGVFTFSPNGVTDVVSYKYGLENSALPNSVAAGTGGVASVTLTPTSWGPLHLYVESVDHVGKASPMQTYEFFVNDGSAPVGYWHLDDGAGSTAADASGNGYTGSLSGDTAWSDGRIGAAATFDGSGDAISTSMPVVHTNQSFTVSAWVRLTNKDAVSNVVGQDGTRASGFYLQYNQLTDRWRFAMTRSDADSPIVDGASSTTPPQLNVWTNLIGVYNAADGSMKLYVNGTLAGSASHTGAWDATGGLQIGRAKWNGAAVNWWAGDIDEVRVYDRVVVDSEIPDLVNRPPLVLGSWPLDEVDGTVANDASGNGNDGIVGGDVDSSPVWSEGVLGNALLLDGSTRSVSMPGPVVRTDQSFTVAAWVRLDNDAQVSTAVSQDGSHASGFYLQYNQLTNRWRFAMTRSDVDNALVDGASSSEPPQLGVWTHLTGVYDAPAHELRLYVNGVFAGSGAHASAWQANGPTQIGRARWNAGPVNWWNGAVDEVHVFAGVLSDSEISDLTSGQLPSQ